MKNEMVKILTDPVSMYILNPNYKMYKPDWGRHNIQSFRADIKRVFESETISNIILRKKEGKSIVVFFGNQRHYVSIMERARYIEEMIGKSYEQGAEKFVYCKPIKFIIIWKEN